MNYFFAVYSRDNLMPRFGLKYYYRYINNVKYSKPSPLTTTLLSNHFRKAHAGTSSHSNTVLKTPP